MSKEMSAEAGWLGRRGARGEECEESCVAEQEGKQAGAPVIFCFTQSVRLLSFASVCCP